MNGLIPRLLACLCVIPALAAGELWAESPLFSSHSVLEITIPLDFKTLCRPREVENCDYTPTVLEYLDDAGDARTIPIEVIIRGGWRSLTRNCSAPLLFIRFDEKDTTGTLFEGQTVLPLTTHCGQGFSIEAAKTRTRPSTWEQYLLKEYLAHRLYNLVTEVSLSARLIKITYPNPDKPSHKIRNYAFFTEHFESVAARNGYELLDRASFDREKLDLYASDLVALFEFMIGNTDWSIARERNIVLLQSPDGSQKPLPYDFDMSGLVNAHYAGPAPGLSITEVVDRYYLGFCHADTEWESLSDRFLSQEAAMLSLVDEIPGLDKKSTKSTRRFLGKFFTILKTPQLQEDEIARHCLPWPSANTEQALPAGRK